jgi:hypothetical protein
VDGPTILYMRYYWVGPPDYIYDITGWAHHIIYAILVDGPTILYMRYYWVGPPYYICDITGWADQIIYTILLSEPIILYMRYYWVGPPYYDITEWALAYVTYDILLSHTSDSNVSISD